MHKTSTIVVIMITHSSSLLVITKSTAAMAQMTTSSVVQSLPWLSFGSSKLSFSTHISRRHKARMPRSVPSSPGHLGLRVRAAAATALLPPQFGYVALTAASSVILTQWQAFQVAAQRRKSGVKYPKMYEDAEDSLFNCYQRAHQNTLENYPAFLFLLLISGLAYPITASIFGLLWVLGRVFYSLGYYTGDPQKRLRGIWNVIGFYGLLVTTLVFAYKQLAWLWFLPG